MPTLSAILDSAEGYVPQVSSESSETLSLARSKFLIPLSASSSEALHKQAQNLAAWDIDRVNVVDLAHTLGTRRSKLTQRSFTLVGQKTMKQDLNPERFITTGVGSFSNLPIAFVFTGQGAQWPQMGKELIEEFPSFRRSIQEMDAVLQGLPEEPSWTLQQALLDPAETSHIGHVTRSQPVCTAIQIAYVQLLARWGVAPVGVIGHSSGEIGAAYAAGRLTAAQAIVIAYYRGFVVGQSSNPTSGAMMAAGLSKEIADSEIEKLDLVGVVKVACVNSPESITMSGDASGIEKILAELQGRGIFARKLNTDGRAYHSHHMTLVGEKYQELLEITLPTLQAHKMTEDVRWVSSVYAEEVTGKVLASYWRKNLESPVLFSDAVEGLVKGHKLHLVELGPHSALELPIKQTRAKIGLTDSEIHYSSALSRGKNAIDCVLSLMGNLYLHGHDVDFAKVNHVETQFASDRHSASQGKVLTDLPPYAWTYDEVLWNESRASKEFRNRKYPHHDLLGSQSLGSNRHVVEWRNVLKVKDIPWVEGHKLGQDVVFPGAGYLAMAIEAICQATGKTEADEPIFTLRHVSISKALQLSMDANAEGVEVFTTLAPLKLSGSTHSEKWFEFAIMSYGNGKSVNHAQGMVSIDTEGPIVNKYPSKGIDLEPLATRNWYDRFDKVGLSFGPTFQTMRKIETHRQKQIMHTRAEVPYLQGGEQGKTKQSAYVIHPITIDTMFQAAIIASSAGIMKDLTCKVPTVIESARFKAPTSNEEDQLWTVDAVSQPVGFSAISIAGEVHNGKGEVCAQVENVSAVTFQGAGQETAEDDRHPMLRVTWKPDISKLQSTNVDAFSAHLNSPDIDSSPNFPDATLRKLGAMVDLFSHKDPRLRILELGEPDSQITTHLLSVLQSHKAFKRFGMYSRGYLSESDELVAEDITSTEALSDGLEKAEPQNGRTYDLVIVSPYSGQEYGIDRLEFTKRLLAPGGSMLSLLPSSVPSATEDRELPVVEMPLENPSIKIVIRKVIQPAKKALVKHDIVIVEREDAESFNGALAAALSKDFAQNIKSISMNKLLHFIIYTYTTVIYTIELSQPILSTLTDAESINVKAMTDTATNLIWLTGGDSMNGGKPDMALVSGLSRALMLEQPSLRFFTFDIDNPDAGIELSIQNIIALVEEAHTIETPDFETVMHKGLVYISRFVPEEILNETFRQKQNDQPMPKALGRSKPAHLTIQNVGQFDSLAFKQTSASLADLKPDHVEVEIKAIALNAKVSFLA